MRRVRIEKREVRREPSWDSLPLDPRDPDVVRAKAVGRSGDRLMHKARR